MASVFIKRYHIDYSTTDGVINEVSRRTDLNHWDIIENEDEIICVVVDVMDRHDEIYPDEGYPAFIYRLLGAGKIFKVREGE